MALACLMALMASCGDAFAASVEHEKEGAEALVNYVIVQEPMLTAPGTQTVMLGIGDGSAALEAASLTYKNQETGEAYEVKAKEILDDFVLFQMEYASDSPAGSYRLERVSYTAGGVNASAAFEEMGIDAAYGVNEAVWSEPDDVLLTDEQLEALAAETEMDVVSLNEEGKPVLGGTMEEALERAGCEIEEAPSSSVRKGAIREEEIKGMRSLKVVLDAGHGGSDPGAQANGVVEKIVNLKIAQYCRKELSEYAGVTIYMTRDSDVYLTLAQRAQVAIDKKADVFISLHNNSNVSAAPNGANVYYPNSNYNANCGTAGRSLASVILSKLTALGLASGGIHIRNSENGTKYPDGSLADYYGVIKRCKENGIPGLIVEHAFISNADDAQNYLSTEEQLKRLGVADATAIAEYYGLVKGLGFNQVEASNGTTMDLSWSAAADVSGYCIYRSLTSGDGFTEVARIEGASTTTWQDKGLTPGTTYYYKIRTYTKTGGETKYGKFSTVASGTTMSNPTISSIRSKNSKELVISWPAVSNAANYEIYRAAKPMGNFKKIATIASINQFSYTDKVKPGKLYYYKIRSIGQTNDASEYSAFSEAVSGRTAVIPTNVFVRSEGSNTLRVLWTADANASGYIIKRAESPGGKYKKVGTAEGGKTSYYDDATVNAKKTYYYKVQAYNHNNGVKGVSGFGSFAYGKTIKKTAITKVAHVSATSQTISWKKVNDVDGYIIYQSTSKNGKYKKIKKIGSNKKTSYQVEGLTPGTRYYYKVRTRKKVNGRFGFGSYSTARHAWTPKEPEITAVAGSAGDEIEVFWNPVGGTEGYDIYRAEAENGTYQKIGTVTDTQVSYTDSGLNMTGTYYYKIEAHIKSYKASSVAVVSNAMGGAPINVTHITMVAPNRNGQMELTWEAVKGIAGYQIYRSAQKDGAYSLIQTISDPLTAKYTDVSATPGVTWYYKVALIGRYGNEMVYGPQSVPASGTISLSEESRSETALP